MQALHVGQARLPAHGFAAEEVHEQVQVEQLTAHLRGQIGEATLCIATYASPHQPPTACKPMCALKVGGRHQALCFCLQPPIPTFPQ